MPKKPKQKKIKFVIVSDNHGDMVDWEAAKSLFDFIQWYQPDEIIHAGDGFDFRSIRGGASANEQSESLEEDLKMGKKFIRHLKPTRYLKGNHCERPENIFYATTNAIVKDYCHHLMEDIDNFLKEVGCKTILPYHADEGVFRIGKVAIVHGYTVNRYSVQEHAEFYGVAGGAVTMGHLHRIACVNARKHGGVVGFCGGHLSRKREMRYAKNRLATSEWGTGWLCGYTQGDDWKIWQIHRVGEKFIYPQDAR